MAATKTLAALATTLAAFAIGNTATAAYVSHAYFEDNACATTPSTLLISINETCQSQSAECVATDYADLVEYESMSCDVNVNEYVDTMFGGVVYLSAVFYNDHDCRSYKDNTVYRANGDCLFLNDNVWVTVDVFTDGSALYQEFDNADCDGEPTVFEIPSSAMNGGECLNQVGYYTNADFSSST